MTIEDVAETADVWSKAIKKIVAAISAAAIALIAAVSGITMLWSNDEKPVPVVRTDFVPGYGPQCSQLMNTIEHTWTESQWAVWERLRKDMGC
jgi:hypothetical protein|tara:strand:- start:1380 stop:1658 length:279 start_codon:yes stop_codon:yes gene_type:complete